MFKWVQSLNCAISVKTRKTSFEKSFTSPILLAHTHKSRENVQNIMNIIICNWKKKPQHLFTCKVLKGLSHHFGRRAEGWVFKSMMCLMFLMTQITRYRHKGGCAFLRKKNEHNLIWKKIKKTYPNDELWKHWEPKKEVSRAPQICVCMMYLK